LKSKEAKRGDKTYGREVEKIAVQEFLNIFNGRTSTVTIDHIDVIAKVLHGYLIKII
jgi:hypothetical protein